MTELRLFKLMLTLLHDVMLMLHAIVLQGLLMRTHLTHITGDCWDNIFHSKGLLVMLLKILSLENLLILMSLSLQMLGLEVYLIHRKLHSRYSMRRILMRNACYSVISFWIVKLRMLRHLLNLLRELRILRILELLIVCRNAYLLELSCLGGDAIVSLSQVLGLKCLNILRI